MISRARRRRAPSSNGGTIEFAELLDPIAPPTVSATVEPSERVLPVTQLGEADEVVEAVEEVEEVEAVEAVETVQVEAVEAVQVEVVEVDTVEPGAAASRFADAGLDDNRLPLRRSRRRWFRR